MVRGADVTYRVDYESFATVFTFAGGELTQGRHTMQTSSAAWGCDPASRISFFDSGQTERCWDTVGAPVESVLQCQTARLGAFSSEGF
ncbi:MAG: hypothetical protein AAF658_20825 [Myxococcota bacterium]